MSKFSLRRTAMLIFIVLWCGMLNVIHAETPPYREATLSDFHNIYLYVTQTGLLGGG